MYRLSIGHNFESAHRLTHPGATVKCKSIHGHSWRATLTVERVELDDRGMVIEFGVFKTSWRKFIDDQVDHHLILYEKDPMADAVRDAYPDSRILLLPSEPTTEHIASWLYDRSKEVLEALGDEGAGVRVGSLHLQETSVNACEYDETRS